MDLQIGYTGLVLEGNSSTLLFSEWGFCSSIQVSLLGSLPRSTSWYRCVVGVPHFFTSRLSLTFVLRPLTVPCDSNLFFINRIYSFRPSYWIFGSRYQYKILPSWLFFYFQGQIWILNHQIQVHILLMKHKIQGCKGIFFIALFHQVCACVFYVFL